MAESRYVMPEDGSWPSGIYQIETTDPVLGYDEATDTDGPANIQWQQLANRTRYLRNLLLAGHTEEGRHTLTDEDFASAAAISEDNILLDYPTRTLASEINALISSMRNTYGLLEDRVQSSLFGLSWSMQKLMPLAWERVGDKCAFEMFTDSMHLSLGKEFRVTKAVYDEEEALGDDSVDVTDTGWETDSTERLIAGEWYVLCDANDSSKWQFVCVSAVLNEHRLLLTGQSKYTITDGWLRPANIITKNMYADAETCFAWVSGVIPAFSSDDDITVTVRHDIHTDVVPKVEYIVDGGEWTNASSYRKEASRTSEDDICVIPRQTAPFRLRVIYEELENPVTFSMIALIALHEYGIIEFVRKPSITATSVSGNTVTVTGDTYRSLYEIPQGGIEAEASDTSNFYVVTASSSATGSVTQCSISVPDGQCYVRIRYKDIEGAYSRWSTPEVIG